MIEMRRVPAILLVFLLGFPLIGPALFADAESNLPACCRRDGKHHCGMTDRDVADAPSSGVAVDALRAKCPFFPNGGAVVPHSETALPAGSQTAGISIVVRVATAPQGDAGYRISFDRSHHKRGPPSLPS
jgi:hypothetical protein